MVAGHTDERLFPLPVLAPEEIELRKKWLEFDSDDETLVKELDSLFEQHIDEIIDDMYKHFLSFEETKSFFPDEVTLKRASSAQKLYFLKLTKGNYDQAYVDDRLRVGSTHHRIDLDPKWYIGAYNRVLAAFTRLLVEHYGADTTKLVKAMSAIRKLTFFDMGLAIETYIWAKEHSIRKHRDAIHDLETERRVTRAILESAPIGIVNLDEHFVCMECNQEFVQMVDAISREDLIGHHLFEIAPQLNRAVFERVLESDQPHMQMADLLDLSKSSSHMQTYWDWAVWPIKDFSGKTTGLVAKFTAATDRVLLQQQREDFVATLTHDLKTPVSAANRAIQLLLDGDFGPLGEPQIQILNTILESNTALYKLVQTLLDVYRYESGAKELHMSPCNLEVTINNLMAEVAPLADHKGVKLNVALPEYPQRVNCDEDEIRRVIQNLVDNSLKFTPPGGSITVKMEQFSGSTTIGVADTGKGILEEDKPKLFQRFWQAASSGRYYASTGLGLYLCRQIVEGHKGRIWCESVHGKGSTFYFTI